MLPLRDANPRHGPAYVTWLLLGLNVAVFLYQLSLVDQRALLGFVVEYGFVPARFFQDPLGEALTLFTSAFIHGGLWHLIGNMIFLLVFGDNVEDRLGHARFAIFYLLGGALAALGHGFFAVRSELPMVGASGAVSALLGGYIMLFPSQRVLTFFAPLFLPWLFLRLLLPVPRFFMLWLPAWLYIGYWAFIQLLEGANEAVVGQVNASGVAWWAHVGGFLFGILLIRRLVRHRSAARRSGGDWQ